MRGAHRTGQLCSLENRGEAQIDRIFLHAGPGSMVLCRYPSMFTMDDCKQWLFKAIPPVLCIELASGFSFPLGSVSEPALSPGSF